MNENNEDIIIDFKKLWQIICHRKASIITCFVLIFLVTLVMTFMDSKKYVSTAKILINKTNSTNLSEINPFILADSVSGDKSAGLAGILGGTSSNLKNEIEILKSEMVLDKVIKENNLKYQEGPKAGNFIEAKNFAGKNLEIKDVKSSNIISISYKSSDPKLSQNVVNSIIKNYKDTYETIYLKKSTKDKKFLEKSYLAAQKSLNNKINDIKRSGIELQDPLKPSTINDLSKLYDRRVKRAATTIFQSGLSQKKTEIEIEQLAVNLKMIKAKYDWISLVEKMTNNASNLTVIEKPELKAKYEFAEPNLNKNLLLAFLLAFTLSSLTISLLEINDKKLTYSDLSNKYKDFSLENFDISNLELEIMANNISKVVLLSLSKKDFSDVLQQKMNNICNTITISSQDPATKLFKEISSVDGVILVDQPGYTDRKFYKNIIDLTKKLNKKIVEEYVILK